MKKIKIVYTSDTHGRLTSYDFIQKTYGPFGLSRLSSYLNMIDEPYLLLDNGDYLQGSPMLDYARKNKQDHPVASMFNHLKYPYITVGNHDFNFGLDHLLSFKDAFNGEILCANIKLQNQYLFKPYVIHDIDDIKLAIIGLTTEYIPFWERKENIKGLTFLDVVKETKDIIKTHQLKEKADVIILLYHGGFERDLKTHAWFKNPTVENKGYQLFQIPEVDLLLTGHQHVPQIHQDGLKVAIQTKHNAQDIGVIDLSFEKEHGAYTLKHVKPNLISLKDYEVDLKTEAVIKDLIDQTNNYLSQKIGIITSDLTIKDPLSARSKKHPLFQLINEIQLSLTGGDISLASLPNDTHGLPHDVSLNDIAVSFPFENDIVLLEVTGDILIQALEQNASYFDLKDGKLIINKAFLIPKVEHYNYDVYDGIEYTMDIKKPIGKRISNVTFKDQPIQMDQTFKLALNSYRATGAGGFDMFQKGKIIKSFTVSYFDLISDYIEKHPNLKINLVENFKIMI